MYPLNDLLTANIYDVTSFLREICVSLTLILDLMAVSV